MKLFLPCFIIALSLSAGGAPAKDSRLYEMRTYYAAPGKLDALHKRFRDHTTKLFEKHGMVNLGYWVPVKNDSNTLVYILAYPSREAREKSWKEFQDDPGWKMARTASEIDGKLVAKVDAVFLQATDFSPEIKPSSGSGGPRTFELRVYKTPPDKLDALLQRFRQHTVGLFSKHGMSQIGYWIPVEKKNGSDNTLIYLLAHESPEAQKKSFSAFRADPAWIAAKTVSEKDGSLTTSVESMAMTPTDYSATK